MSPWCSSSTICGCDTSCCCFFKIPVEIGYVICCFWLIFNGLTFPFMSLVFWPKDFIFYGSIFLCLTNAAFGTVSLVNMRYKMHKLFNVVLYGVLATYVSGGLFVTVGVNVDIKGNSKLLTNSLQNNFNLNLQPSATFQILEAVQIVFYAYLFGSYVYCGFVLQLFELKHDKRYQTRRFS